MGTHGRLQEETKRQSKLSEAISLVSNEVAGWWTSQKFECKSQAGLVKMLEKLYTTWKQLKDTRKRNSSELEKKRETYLENVDKTFWAVSPEFEESLSTSKDASKMEDWEFLLRMKTDRRASVGSVDKIDLKR